MERLPANGRPGGHARRESDQHPACPERNLGDDKRMCTLSIPFVFWSTIVIQVLGLASIIAVRFCTDARRCAYCHRVFILALLALGLVTVLAAGSSGGCWVASGATLPILTVCATLDLGNQRREATSF